MEFIKVNFGDAIMLMNNGRDVIVYEATTGDCFNIHNTWIHQGVKHTLEEVNRLCVMDNHYIFIWVKSRVSN